MTLHSIVTKIPGKKRGPSEGVWVQGGGIELQVLCLWTEETQDPIVLRQTKKYMCMGYCIVFVWIRGEFPSISPRAGDLYSEWRCKGGFFFLRFELGRRGLFSEFYGISCCLRRPYLWLLVVGNLAPFGRPWTNLRIISFTFFFSLKNC